MGVAMVAELLCLRLISHATRQLGVPAHKESLSMKLPRILDTNTHAHPAAARSRWGLSRRGFLRATSAAGTLAAIAVSTSGCKRASAPSQPGVVTDIPADYIIDPQTNESNYSVVDMPLKAGSAWEFLRGTTFYPSDGTMIAAISPSALALPMVKGCVLSLEKGTISDVIADVYTKDSANYVIYDVRCSNALYAWIELDVVTHNWSLYAQAMANGATHGSVLELWQSTSDYLPAQFAVSGSSVVWQVCPHPKKSKARSHSYAYIWKLGDEQAQQVVESNGRFACPPSISKGTCVLVPRLTVQKSQLYCMNAYTLSSGFSSTIATLTLPSGVAPLDVQYISNKFAFSIAANYQSGGLLGKMGTYIGTTDGLCVLSREPSAPVCGCGDTFIVRNRTSYFVINTATKSYSVLPAANRCSDFGEYPACAGEQKTFVTYATIKDKDTGYPKNMVVRLFSM